MNHPIDVIVPWVNPFDQKWVAQYSYWKELEFGQKSSERFRDMGTFNFFFRGMERNCPWINRIILVLSDESQVPDWLNTDHQKLKIVYHREFIPPMELPTFNSSVINCYMSFIQDLSENFILCNDDLFFIKPTEETDFFREDMPVFTYKPRGAYGTTYWHKNLDNGKRLLKKYIGNDRQFSNDHGPIAFKKTLQQFIWHKCGNELQNGLSNSRFRLAKNYTDWVFLDFQANMGLCAYDGSTLTTYYNSFDNIPFPNTKVVCFNDTERITPEMFPQVARKVTEFLRMVLPEKCSFER